MITKEIEGDIWETTCQVIVVPTNCVGVMGKGLAKQVREREPLVYRAYKHLHENSQLSIKRPDLINNCEGRHFLLFPTKKHWRDPSELHWVEHNLRWIRDNHPAGDLQGITSMAIPPVGCGLGGLDYSMVKELIHLYLSEVEFEIHLYLPYAPKLGIIDETEEEPWPTPPGW